MAKATEFFESYGPSLLGLQILRLFHEIDAGGTKAIASNTGLPAKVGSFLIFLKHHGPSSISDLAKAVSVSHQLASQRVDILAKNKLIVKVTDPADQRRTLIKLNRKGLKAAAEIELTCNAADDAYRQLFKEINADLFTDIVKACHALEERSLDLRIRDAAASKKRRVKKNAA